MYSPSGPSANRKSYIKSGLKVSREPRGDVQYKYSMFLVCELLLLDTWNKWVTYYLLFSWLCEI